MGAFLSVAKGSTEPPWLLEVRLNISEEENQKEKPIVLVGKGLYVRTVLRNCLNLFHFFKSPPH